MGNLAILAVLAIAIYVIVKKLRAIVADSRRAKEAEACAAVAKSNATGIIEARFSPGIGIRSKIIEEISLAKTEILMLAYTFTARDILAELQKAKNRGVEIKAIIDADQCYQCGTLTLLSNSGIQCRAMIEVVQHSKTLIIDRHIVITGSSNFTKATKQHCENAIFIYFNEQLASTYISFFKTLWSLSGNEEGSFRNIEAHIESTKKTLEGKAIWNDGGPQTVFAKEQKTTENTAEAPLGQDIQSPFHPKENARKQESKKPQDDKPMDDKKSAWPVISAAIGILVFIVISGTFSYHKKNARLKEIGKERDWYIQKDNDSDSVKTEDASSSIANKIELQEYSVSTKKREALDGVKERSFKHTQKGDSVIVKKTSGALTQGTVVDIGTWWIVIEGNNGVQRFDKDDIAAIIKNW